MFTVIQERDFSDQPLYEPLVRTVYAVDRETESFLVAGFFDDWVWIPMKACKPVK